MKKITSILIVVIMIFSFCACGELSTTTNPEGSTSQNNSGKETKDNETEKTVDKITFTELVAVDNSECSIKITGIEEDSISGFTLKAQLENKSTDKTYMFSVITASVNGVEFNPFFAYEVAAGKKSNEKMTFSDKKLGGNNVGDFTDIELTFSVHDSKDFTADDVAEETVHIYPYGEEKAVKFERESQSTDVIVLDNEYVTVIVTGYTNDDIWGYSANVFFVNKTDKNLKFSVAEASVNGFMADPFFATSLSAGKCSFNSITWSKTVLEENDITDVEKIEFKLRVYDSENWLGDDISNATVTLNP